VFSEEQFARRYDVEDLVQRYDADFDIPLRQKYAIAILRMNDAFEADPTDAPALARRVGAFWCDIVRCDIDYDLVEALRLIDASRSDAERLHATLSNASDTFPRYAAARWFDGTGKIRYRLGSYARARMSFGTAVEIAAEGGLWWCLPDLRSNLLRAEFEERKQTVAADPKSRAEDLREPSDKLLAGLKAERDRVRQDAADHAILEHQVSPASRTEVREFLRGLSNVLHNLAIALKEQGFHDESLSASKESLRISERLADQYRIGQSQNHQAQLDRDHAPSLYGKLREGAWRRGRLIARQQLAALHGGAEGAQEIQTLLDELTQDDEIGSDAGTDIDLHAYTVRTYSDILDAAGDRIDEARARNFADDLKRQRANMAQSVRRAIAMPAYKRAYAIAIRPSYLEQVAGLIAPGRDGVLPGDVPASDIEEALGLTEESSARELLDMLSTAALPHLAVPESTAVLLPAPVIDGAECPEPATRGGARRAGIQRADQAGNDDLLTELARRETEFEEQFLRRPLEAAPHDPEIAHRVRMYTVNNPGTCVVRYFTYGPRRATGLGAFVFQGNQMTCVAGIPYEEVSEFAQSLPTTHAPSKQDSERIWELLIAPIWAAITAGGDPTHLVVIPADDIFTIPIHVASPPSSAVPLAVRLPLSQSVSATAFVGRGRHLLKKQPVDPGDDLAAIVVARRGVSGHELLQADWPAGRMVVVGDRPDGLQDVRHHPADMSGITAISDTKPEFFVYAGHGNYHPSFPQLGPYLELSGNYLTQYDVALRLRLPRNKLTVLGACLAGQGAQTAGGDVIGFLRSLIATGAGAIGVPLWSVLDTAMADTAGALLSASRAALAEQNSIFDVVHTLHAHYRDYAAIGLSFEDLAECMPLSLYL